MQTPSAGRGLPWPALALLFNAFTWGLSWWPMRELAARGLHPLWLTALIFLAAAVLLALTRRGALRDLLNTPVLWVLVVAAGTTNATFNWAVAIGDVVRVVLLFYLMPLWAVLLARPLLGERISPRAALRVAIALAGALVVLWPAEGGALPWPRSLADWLGLAGGFSFALNNVMLRREAHRSEGARALAMFLGGGLVSLVLVAVLAAQGQASALPPPSPAWLLPLTGLTLWFLASNLALQYGAARLPAARTAVIMITEVFFASASSVALGAGSLSTPTLVGGALILAAAALAAVQRD